MGIADFGWDILEGPGIDCDQVSDLGLSAVKGIGAPKIGRAGCL